jgi:uncharacterized protein YeaO (DUF488 family)
MSVIRIKRAYDPVEADDGSRFLVDRLWPRGVTKVALEIQAWARDAAPSTDLRRWYHHEPAQWNEFRKRYFAELASNRDAWLPLLDAARREPITLLYASKVIEQNNAVALKEFLERALHKDTH